MSAALVDQVPVRPNPVALAVVELLAIAGSTLTVRKVDCIDGTPLLDIKPYFASTDAFADAVVGRPKVGKGD